MWAEAWTVIGVLSVIILAGLGGVCCLVNIKMEAAQKSRHYIRNDLNAITTRVEILRSDVDQIKGRLGLLNASRSQPRGDHRDGQVRH